MFTRLTDVMLSSANRNRRVSSSESRLPADQDEDDEDDIDEDANEFDDLDRENAIEEDELDTISASQDDSKHQEEEQDHQEENSKKNDWYLEFSINGEVIPLETTIYGAIYRSFQASNNTHNTSEPIDTSEIWGRPHLVKFRKVSGKEPLSKNQNEQLNYASKTSEDDLTALNDTLSVSILKLLKILFNINAAVEESGTNDSLFLNWKLTAKLNRQLEEPLIVVSGTLPGWSVHITKQFPFLFPINSRLFFLQSTSFGYSRLIQQWKIRTSEENGNNSNSASANAITELGRPNRHKIRISRKHILQSGIKLLDMYGNHPSVLEIEYFNEEGSGLGPTLEFYSTISREFCRKSLKLWRKDDNEENPYVHYPTGLFPTPINDTIANSSNGKKVLSLFKMLGKLVARALLDSRLVDFAFNKFFFELASIINATGVIKYNKLPRTAMIGKVANVDGGLAKSLLHLHKYLEIRDAQKLLSSDAERIQVDGATLEDLALTFTLPGYSEIELVANGDDISVTMANLAEYIDDVVDLTIGSGVVRQINAFIDGFSQVFPYNAITIFTPGELISMFGNGEEDWSFETLYSSIHANHGYTVDSESVIRLLEIMTSFNKDERRRFLQFMTGSPKLPIGGFKALRPEFTVVRKPSEDGFTADDYLPSVMTCANYLKLPEYSSKDKMRDRLLQSINEGLGAFLLS